MGGYGQAIVEEAPTIFRSMEHIASQTEVGKLWVNVLKNEVEPAIGKLTTAHLNAGMKPEEAMGKAKSIVKEQVFGKKNVGMMGVLQAAKKQGGEIAAEHLADAHNIYWAEDSLQGSTWRAAAAKGVVKKGVTIRPPIDISPNSAYKGQTKLEQGAKQFSRMTQLSMISIPHALQAPLNSLAVNGWTSTIKAAAEFMRDPATARGFALKAGAMGQEMAYEMIANAKGQTKFSMLLDPLKKAFTAERKFGITLSAVSGKHAAIDAADTFFKSGGNDKTALLQLKLLGLDPAAIMKQGGQLATKDIELAAFRSASELMGYRSPLETPMVWEKNSATRIGTIYKQYGFRAMRVHQQVLQRAYEGGGMIEVAKKLATYATVFPIAGELIKGAEGLLSLQDPWSKEKQQGNIMHSEYLDACAAAMGFNLVYSATRSATYHKLIDFIVGPIASTVGDIGQDVINMTNADSKKRGAAERQLGKDVVRRAGLPGRILSHHLFPPKHNSNTQ